MSVNNKNGLQRCVIIDSHWFIHVRLYFANCFFCSLFGRRIHWIKVWTVTTGWDAVNWTRSLWITYQLHKFNMSILTDKTDKTYSRFHFNQDLFTFTQKKSSEIFWQEKSHQKHPANCLTGNPWSCSHRACACLQFEPLPCALHNPLMSFACFSHLSIIFS